MRLDKYISKLTGLSRSQAQLAIRRGAVKVDGAAQRDPSVHISATDAVAFRGEPLGQLRKRYYMLHKPLGYVCATEDREHPTVIDLLGLPNPAGLHVAGRLDIDTTGLVLITDDGDWSHRVTAPRRHCPKTYHVWLAEPLDDDLPERFAGGMQLNNEKQPTQPAELEILGACEARLTISEGKYHQVKRMFAASGNRVTRLHRESIGAIRLDDELAPGEYRELSEAEVAGICREDAEA